MMSNVSSEDKNQQIIVGGEWAGRVSAPVTDELPRRQDRLLERRHKLARFRDPDRTLDTFDFDFNKKLEPRPDLRACGRPRGDPAGYLPNVQSGFTVYVPE